MKEVEDFLQNRISRTEKKVKIIKERHGDNAGLTYTYHGGWDLGYYEGMLSAYHNILDKISRDD